MNPYEQKMYNVALDLMKKNGQTTTLEVKQEFRSLYPAERCYQTQVSNIMDDFAAQGFFSFVDQYNPTAMVTHRIFTDNQSTQALIVSTPNTITGLPAATVAQGFVQGAIAASQQVGQNLVSAVQAGINAATVTVSPQGGVSKKRKRKSRFNPPAVMSKLGRHKAIDLMKEIYPQTFTAQFLDKDGNVRIMNGFYIKDQVQDPLGYIKVKEMIKTKLTPNDCIRTINPQTLQILKIKGQYYSVG
jgi:hypothetical protein